MKITEDLERKRIIVEMSKSEAENFLTDLDQQIKSFHYKITGEFIERLKFSWNVLNQYLMEKKRLG